MKLITGMRAAAIGLLAPFLLPAVSVMECPTRPPTAASYTWDFSAEANNLFDEFESYNRSLINVSDRLVSFTDRPMISWRSHSGLLMQAKEDVNKMNEILCRLTTIKSAVDPWQVKLIDRIHEDTILAATNVEAAIEYLNGNRSRVEDTLAPAYSGHLEAVYSCANDLNNRIDAYTQLASARLRVKELEPAS